MFPAELHFFFHNEYIKSSKIKRIENKFSDWVSLGMQYAEGIFKYLSENFLFFFYILLTQKKHSLLFSWLQRFSKRRRFLYLYLVKDRKERSSSNSWCWRIKLLEKAETFSILVTIVNEYIYYTIGVEKRRVARLPKR